MLSAKTRNTVWYQALKNSFVGALFRGLRELPYTTRTFFVKLKDIIGASSNPKLLQLHKDMRHQLDLQRKNSERFVYSWGYFYQGWDRIKATGIRETDSRLKIYGIKNWLTKDMDVLDIGCNSGFFSLSLADAVRHVDAIDWNPYLVEIGKLVQKYLGITNVDFANKDFNTFGRDKKYHAIISFANHHTTDGGMKPKLSAYFQEIHERLHAGGYFFFETHPAEIHDKSFLAFMDTIGDLYTIEDKKLQTNGWLSGWRLYYVLKKKS